MSEIISKRTENSKTFDLGNGNFRQEICIGAVHYKDDYNDEKELFKDIDLTWENNKITKAPYTLERVGNKITVLDKKTGKTGTIEIDSIGDIKLSSDKIKDSKTSDVAEDVDIEIIPSPDSIRFQTIIKKEKALAKLKYKISGSMSIKYSAVDDDGDSVPLITSVIDGVLTEEIDMDNFTSNKPDKNKVKYPIKIDPTLTIQGSGADTWINGYAATTNYGSGTYIQPYYNSVTSYRGRALVNMSLSEVPTGALINSADFSIYYYEYDTYSPEGDTYYVYKVRRSDWVDSEATHNIYKTGSDWGTAGCTNTTSDIDTSVSSSATWRTGYGWQTFDVQDIVEDAISNSVNFNVRISTETAGIPHAYSKEYATDTTKRPKLVINYTVAPDAPTNVSATENNSSKVVITWTKSSEATNYAVLADGDNISGTLGDVATYDDTTAAAPIITPGTASATKGAFSNKVVLSLSGESIADGTSYSYTVKAYNAAGWSSKSSANAGYRKASSLSYQWQVSAGDDSGDGSALAFVDGGLEIWTDATHLTNWTFAQDGTGGTLNREATEVKVGTYSAKVTVGTASTYIAQGLGITYNGKTITVGCWCKSDNAVANKVMLLVHDVVGGSIVNVGRGYYQNSQGWEYLTATIPVDVNNTGVCVQLRCQTGANAPAYFDVVSGAVGIGVWDGANGLTVWSDITGTTNPYNYTGAPAGGRYYRCKVTSTGAADAYSTADRGFKGGSMLVMF
jgi:hypothetical protein